MIRNLLLKLMALAFVFGVTMTPAMADSDKRDSAPKPPKHFKSDHDKKDHDKKNHDKKIYKYTDDKDDDEDHEDHNRHPENY